MARQKIDYGIDLGTTNSSIARSDNGKIRLFQHEPYKKTIMPSCIHFSKRAEMLIGDLAYNKLPIDRKNTFDEFKRTMGEDLKYYSSNIDKSFTSEELSAEVLKQLKLSVKDEEISFAIITVPAAFNQVQIEATRRAAEMAGFEYFELLQEPIAASLAFFNDQKNIEGIWLVFDLGGGTFDAALVKIEEGIMQVIDHEGDNHLGGKDMDLSIVDEIVVPELSNKFPIRRILNDEEQHKAFRNALKYEAEQTKIQLSEKSHWFFTLANIDIYDDNDNKIDHDIKIDRAQFEKLITPIIDRAIKICKDLIKRKGLTASDLRTVLMVGGPTYIPFLREKVKEELYKNINVTIDPMTVVAQGAALFASTRSVPVQKQKRDFSKIQLILAYPDTTVESEINLGIKVERDKIAGTIPLNLFALITRSDKAWTTGKVKLESDKAVISLNLLENSTNSYSIQLFDGAGNKVGCEPNSISILQGIKIAQPPLPHDIGVSAIVRELDNIEEMVPILKKGTPLPAVGKKTFVAPKNLRPGNSEDVLWVIIWEGKGGTRPIRNVHMGELKISGDKLSSLLPEGSEIEVAIRMDESRTTKASAYIPYLDETIEKVVDPDYKLYSIRGEELLYQINKEKDRMCDLQKKSLEISQLADSGLESIDNALNDLADLNEKGTGDRDRSRQVQNRINELGSRLDEIEKNIKFPQKLNELKEKLKETEQIVDSFGDEKASQILSNLKPEIEKTIELKNNKRATAVIEKLCKLKFSILFNQPMYWVSVLTNIIESFDEIRWSDHLTARNLINKGSELIVSEQFSDEIKHIVFDLWKLMPESDREKTKAPRTDILHYYKK